MMIKKGAKGALLMFLALCLSACTFGGGTQNDPNQGQKPPSGQPEPVLSGAELARAMMASPYQAELRTDGTYGLSDPSQVGANEQAFTKEKYPVPADGKCTVYEAKDHGVTVDGEKNAENLNSLLYSLRNVSGVKKIRFEDGAYRFSMPVKIYNLSDLYLCGGENTEFCATEWMTVFDIYNCKNLHFNDISVDYDPSPVISGTVASCDLSAKQAVIEVGEEFDLSLPVYNGGKFTYGSYIEYVYDDLTKAYMPDENGNLKYNDMIAGGGYDKTNDRLTLTFTDMKEVKVGTPVAVAFTMYNYPCIQTIESRNVYFENVDIYTSPGMAFYNISCQNLYFNRSDVVRKKGSTRLMTATADCIHCKDCTGNLQITGCILEASHDDGVNICNFYKTVTAVSGNTIECAGRPGYDFPLERGNKIDIYRASDYGFVGTFKVLSVEKNNLQYTVTVDGDTAGVESGYLVGNATRVPRVTIENNIIRNKRNRGILVQFRNSRIVNNAFINVMHGPIMMHSTADIFKEAIVPRDIEISGNKFINNNALSGTNGDIFATVWGEDGTTEPGTITGIFVKNNFFCGSAQSGVYIRGGGRSEISNNLFFDICTKAGGYLLASTSLNRSKEIIVKDNYALFSAAKEGFVSVYESESENITNENNSISVG